ncbi:teichoic acids export ABC transporter ATP-binding subunit TagH [Bacillus rubiinfantis]|uniref:teichoic acids export ABC transporter ATP-binding subunit TagH n=1 Tax=Bacillus rubiinfantis TaxID=1499680 RepID=UPI0005AA0D24|nr:teichoic acids export ABC transporter ATP-binding subunit TagH [Bacillus rubiinfantis]
MSIGVAFNNVTKKYKMYKKTSDKLLDLILPNGYGEDFYALQNITFEAKKGDIIGIIGVNGAGKSTISNLISGVVPPTSGIIKTKGDAALISIGAGLNNQLTGRENIELKCLMLGFSKKQIRELEPQIIDFAEIGDFIDQPVKKYSSGMKSRLGFAISVNIDPDILVIDEALSVGDKIFAQKCLDKMNSFKEKGKTIFFISHSIGQVKEFCQKALWLEGGQVKAYGPIDEVIPQYEKFIKAFNKMSKEERQAFNKRIAEMRSRKQDIVKEKIEIQEIQDNSISSPTRSNRSRIKPKRIVKKVITSLVTLIFVVAALLLFLKWNPMTFFQTENNENAPTVKHNDSIKKKTKSESGSSKEVATKANKDIRYVQLVTGFVRDIPDLANSKRVQMVYFGDAITVDEIVKDPTEDFNWLKFNLSDGQTGWISEKLVEKLETRIDEKKLVMSIDDIVQGDQFRNYLSYLGKTKQESQSLGNELVDIAFDQNERINEITIAINTVINENQIITKLGEPSLLQSAKAILYHGKEHDFIFYSNGYTVNKITVKQVSKKDSV